ncbi:hypothetical protein QAD02_009987 [Eretmocerus hayati]|uniref:Uncharacterized protein n=1 Tax=Eretmocerus hayati TaxID=131215 RepID=A0ACC2NB95_9HYME|nr:hypothetical protein QAD02_009987 [Eretmocerus hayati]
MAAAAQFSPVNTSMQHQQQQQYNFISSNAYYGYVPLPRAASSTGPQVDIISDDTHMLVDTPFNKKAKSIVSLGNYSDMRKKILDWCPSSLLTTFGGVSPFEIEIKIDLGSGNKRLFHGAGEQCFWTEGYGLAKMYNGPSVLRLSPAAADSNINCQTSPGKNIQFQSRSSNGVRTQELEDMLLLTHGCSSYHHYRNTQLNLNNDYMESEF